MTDRTIFFSWGRMIFWPLDRAVVDTLDILMSPWVFDLFLNHHTKIVLKNHWRGFVSKPIFSCLQCYSMITMNWTSDLLLLFVFLGNILLPCLEKKQKLPFENSISQLSKHETICVLWLLWKTIIFTFTMCVFFFHCLIAKTVQRVAILFV